MKLHVTILLLLIGSAVGSPFNLFKPIESAVGTVIGAIANATKTEPDIYINDEHGNPVKIDLSAIGSRKSLVVAELPDLIFFYLYTNETGSSDPEILRVGDVDALNNSSFDANRSTKFITHGWRSSCNSEACTLIRDAYLNNGNYNVILIDWGQLAHYEYVYLTVELPKIAQYVSSMIDFLVSEGVDADDIAIVGHSLGAHVAGLASYYATEKVGAVYGLDPAGPLFTNKGKESRISKDDGKYVEVIHTTTVIGLPVKLGHVDFYPNGALSQPGCTSGESCGHGRSYQYFAESINNNDFPARKCDSYLNFKLGSCNSNAVGYMGGATPNSNVIGTYFLTTNAQSPYGKNTI